MKYFTKYISVEGEIKEGDKVYNDDLGIVTIKTQDGLNTINRDPHGFKKVKLFLCSRDIHIRDFVKADYWIDKGGELESHIVKEGECIEYDEKLDHYSLKEPDDLFAGKFVKSYALKEGCFKIIGKVSTNARWVKEGMEFEEDEWRALMMVENKKLGSVFVDKKHIDRFLNKGILWYVALKCSQCNTFH